MDTIFAPATAAGKAGIAVVRVSGSQAWVAARSLTRTSLPTPRQAGLRKIFLSDGSLLDEALILTFAEDSSFTGEEVVEFHLHGSSAVVKALTAVLGNIPGLRWAEPGEFTRRALENERLDLAQVEGVADLIEAETEAQRRQAVRALSGALGEKAEFWRSKLIRAGALLEATIDFVDEDVPVDVRPEVTTLIDQVATSLKAEAKGALVAERIRDGFEVAIVGPPNVGKSTLLNALAGRDAAITSETAGTTRDVIEVRMDLKGLAVTVLDTAGLRETKDTVEALGVQRAISRASDADLRVFLSDGSTKYSGLDSVNDDIQLLGKIDLVPGGGSGVSGKTGEGVSELVLRITEILETRSALAATATRARHRVAIVEAQNLLRAATDEIENGQGRTEFAAEELRRAVRSLDSLVGLVDVEHVLDEIFSSFCVGK